MNTNYNILKNQLTYTVLVVFFLAFLSIAIHRKAYSTVAPPIYDPISYYCKSKIVWDAIDSRTYSQIINVFPLRPPGTAFILYPTGFSPSIKSFLFRAEIAPVLIWGLALAVLLIPLIRTNRDVWSAAAISGLLFSMPLFYHFEISKEFTDYYGDCFQWGMVDGLQAALAALAVGLLYWGIDKESKLLCALYWMVGGLTFFVKPSGILVIGCLFTITVTELYVKWRRDLEGRNRLLKIGLFSLLFGCAVTAASLLLAFNTEYLGKQVVSTALVAAKILIGMYNQPASFYLKNLVIPVIGIWALIPLGLMTLFLAVDLFWSVYHRRITEAGIRFLVSLALLSGAVYWWRYMAGIQTRYLFPFLLLAIAWFVPSIYGRIVKLNRPIWIFTICYLTAPALILVYLLYSSSDQKSFQKLMGYNLTVGQFGQEMKTADFLIGESVKAKHPIVIYNLGGWRAGVIEMVDWIDFIDKQKSKQAFDIYRVNDWIHPGVKIKEILSADYFIIEDKTKHESSPIGKIQTWQQEEQLLDDFIQSLGLDHRHGVEKISSGTLTLYKVTDRKEFAKACRDWVGSIDWSEDFHDRNIEERGDYDLPGLKVMEGAEAQKKIAKSKTLMMEVIFEKMIKLLAVTKSEFRGNPPVYSFYFQALQKVSQDYSVFIHLLDANKKIIYQHDFVIDPKGGGIPPGAIWRSIVEIPNSELSASAYLAFGVYIPTKEASFLVSNYSECDWGGRRVLIPLKK